MGCLNLTSIAMPSGMTSIGNSSFASCFNLTNVTIPNGVTNIGGGAFSSCNKLSKVVLPDSVLNIGSYAFGWCSELTGLYFQGNAPSMGSFVFYNLNTVTVYYLPGTIGWAATFGGRPTAPWFLPNPVALSSGAGFGVQTNAFAFVISWATNASIVVEACTNLTNPNWLPLQTNTLTAGSSYFSDSQWTNHPSRFYRLRSPN